MRLLQRKADAPLVLTTFPDDDPPPFAILSHTWGKDQEEISYSDIDPERGHGTIEGQARLSGRPGYAKLDFCLSQAARDGIQYVWIDTCCINKESQTELNKAINWMFRWYAAAQVCFVYLSDVDASACDLWRPTFRASRWFTRGWTLQELLAPAKVDFFSKDGQRLGSKDELAELIESITSIPVTMLRGQAPLRSFSIQKRFDWAQGRETTEPEDRVYSLFGILGVSFTPNHGEGNKAAMGRLRSALIAAYQDDVLILNFRQPVASSSRVSNIAHVNRATAVDAENAQKWINDIYHALNFEQKDQRRSNIRRPTAQTCEWLLENPMYQKWHQVTKNIPSELLWIKGKPGAGKSTLLKFADERAVVKATKSRRDVVISFYFNARGARLEHSFEGMYRSLLCQLISSVDMNEFTSLVDSFKKNFIAIPHGGSPWPIESLQTLLSLMANRLQGGRLTIFIDALDECKDTDVQDTLYFLDDLRQNAIENERQILMCFASRYYPTMILPPALEVRLDNEAGHAKSLEMHVARSLHVGQDARADAIKSKLLKKAHGVFIWAVLVIKILNTEYQRGLVVGLQTLLDSLPEDMSKLFQEIIKQEGPSHDDLALALQWILYARRPLTGREFYCVMMAGSSSRDRAYSFDLDEISDADIERLVSHTSKGLAEVTSSGGDEVEFMHETVREYLLHSGGLGALLADRSDLSGAGHECIEGTCEAYLEHYVGCLRKDQQNRHCRTYRANLVRHAGLLAYAADNIFFHSEQASDYVDQTEFLRSHEGRFWQDMQRLAATQRNDKWVYYGYGLLHLLVQKNTPNLIKTCVRAGIDSVEALDVIYCRTPLIMACRGGHYEAVKALLESGAIVRVKDFKNKTPMDYANARQDKAIAKLLEKYTAQSVVL